MVEIEFALFVELPDTLRKMDKTKSGDYCSLEEDNIKVELLAKFLKLLDTGNLLSPLFVTPLESCLYHRFWFGFEFCMEGLSSVRVWVFISFEACPNVVC